MNAIIEETASDYNKSDITMNQRSILFSQGYNRLQSDLPFLRGSYFLSISQQFCYFLIVILFFVGTHRLEFK